MYQATADLRTDMGYITVICVYLFHIHGASQIICPVLNRIINAGLNYSNTSFPTVYVNYILFNYFGCQTLTFTIYEIQSRL